MIKSHNPLKYRYPKSWGNSGALEPKSTPAMQDSRTQQKMRYRKFWKQRIFNSNDAKKLENWIKYYERDRIGCLNVLRRIPEILHFQHTITLEQKTNLDAMLQSVDGENATVAITILMQLAGRRMCGGKKRKI